MIVALLWTLAVHFVLIFKMLCFAITLANHRAYCFKVSLPMFQRLTSVYVPMKAMTIVGRRAQRSQGGHARRGHLKRSVTWYTSISRLHRTLSMQRILLITYFKHIYRK